MKTLLKVERKIRRTVFKALWKVLDVKSLLDLSFVTVAIALFFVFMFVAAITADPTSMVYQWIHGGEK